MAKRFAPQRQTAIVDQARLRGIQHPSGVYALAFRPGDKHLVSGGMNRVIRVWDIDAETPTNQDEDGPHGLVSSFEGHTEQISGLCFDAAGHRFVSASHDQSLIVWDWESQSQLATLKGSEGRVLACGLSADGGTVVSAGLDFTLRIWDVAGASSVAVIEDGLSSCNRCLVDEKRQRVLMFGWDRGLAFCDLREHTVLKTIQLKGVPNGPAVIHPNGHNALIVDDALTVIDLAECQTTRRLELHGAKVDAMAMIANGKVAVTAGSDRQLSLWVLETGECILTLDLEDSVYCIAVSSDGRRIATGSWGSIEVWDTAALLEAANFDADEYSADPFGPVQTSGGMEPGKTVTLTSGIYSGFEATVVDVSGESANVEVEMFGRKTSVAVSFSDLGGHPAEPRIKVLAYFREKIDIESEVATAEDLREYWRSRLDCPKDKLADEWDKYPHAQCQCLRAILTVTSECVAKLSHLTNSKDHHGRNIPAHRS